MTDRKIDYERVFTAGAVPLLILTPDLVIVAVNDAYLRMVRRTRADLLGRHVLTVFPGDPDAPEEAHAQGAELLRASLGRAAAGERDTLALQRYDIETTRGSGVFEERYWSATHLPIPGADGEMKLIVQRIEEVTDFLRQLRRSGEHAIAGQRAEPDAVETAVFARARELHRLNERLEQAHRQQLQVASALQGVVERQRRFVFDASHDLRNPIAGLLTEVEVALSAPDADLPQILHRVLRTAGRLNDIVADLLELARMDTAAPSVTESVDLVDLVTDELERRTFTCAVHTRLDQKVTVHASRIRLARLLGNLLANAERHAATTMEIVVTADPPYAVLEVVNDGPGIALDDRERIFERRYRLDDARRQDPGGSGLGLPIAREIAHTHGGHLHAAEHSDGARFILQLPLAAGTQAAERDPATVDDPCRTASGPSPWSSRSC